MRDYAELVKALRYCSDIFDFHGCLECVYEQKCREYSRDRSCINQPKVMVDAAAAIEELLAAVPKWISVEERLPDEWREVLTHSPIHSDEKNPHMIQLCWYIGNGKWRECQYGEIMEIPITHWMPLPEAPKEGTE